MSIESGKPTRWLPLLIAALLAFSGIAAAKQGSADRQRSNNIVGTTSANLLINSSFEGVYTAYEPPNGHPDCPANICTTAQMAPGWTPWWVSHDDSDLGYIIRMPEYKPAAPYAERIHAGENAQQLFTFSSTHRAGFYQRVPVQPSQLYRLKIWGHSWASFDDNPNTSDNPLNQQIGIDPTGGTEWDSPDVIWSDPHQQHNQYGLFMLCAVAQSEYLTVFTFSEPRWAAKHNDVYWDSAELTAYEQPCKNRMRLSVSGNIASMVTVGEPESSSSVLVSVPVDPAVTWSASVNQGGTLTPTLENASGSDGDTLTIIANSANKPTGQYSGTVSISSNPPVIGSPATLTVTQIVVSESRRFFLPMVAKTMATPGLLDQPQAPYIWKASDVIWFKR